jgi:hypothetical protein
VVQGRRGERQGISGGDGCFSSRSQAGWRRRHSRARLGFVEQQRWQVWDPNCIFWAATGFGFWVWRGSGELEVAGEGVGLGERESGDWCG